MGRRDSPAGGYTLRVLYTEPGGRALLRAWTLTLDEQRPRIADATAAPNPFEPRPHDGDRDTTTFAMTSSERGRLRAVVYRHASTEVVRVLVSRPPAARLDRAGVVGRVAAGDLLLRARGHRRRRQHLPVATAPRAGAVSPRRSVPRPAERFFG